MKKNKLLLISAAALVVAASAYFLFFNDKSVEVSTMNTYKTNIIKTIEVSGIINSKDIEVISLEPGKKVVKAYVKENDIVKKNQLLSELDADDLNISLQKAKLSLEDLNTKLSDLNNNNNDLVILKNTVEKNKENYSKVSNDLALAQEDLQRAENLYAERVISKAEYEKYVSAVNNLKSSLKTQELNLYDSNVNYKDKTDQRTLDKLSLQSQIESIKLDIESLNNKIEDTKIYSSIDGIVTEFPLKELQETLSGEKIIIHSNSSLELTALVSQEEAVLIDEGQKSIVTIDG
ncbi:MAG TPA: biotin/lipoyl-binding protein, partial [Sedimentibacter sp.]|nr:biotin/lipoyl-binding protein [Sedimentibacter sp.]